MAKNPSSQTRCTAKTKTGKRCRRNAVQGSAFCMQHFSFPNEDALSREYSVIAPTAARFASTLQEQLEMMLATGNLTLGVPIEVRVKEWESIADKIARNRLKLTSLRELTDLVGLWLILLFKRDLPAVQDLISESFSVVSHEDTSARLSETQFGYQSVHYVIKLPGDWLRVPTLADFTGLRAEIQVRTLAQHIRAAASHKLQYKSESNVPAPIRRSIYRVSAILETVDLEFERVLT